MSVRADDVDLRRDSDLVTRYQDGDADAFADLYARYFDRLTRYCERRVHDSHVAEEIAQETFVRALGNMPSFGGDRRFYPWLTVIAQRLCVDHHRHAERVRLAPEVDAGSVEGADGPALEQATLDLLDAALARVTPRHREVLLLREAEGLSYHAIGARLGTPRTTVEALLHRARRALRREATEVAGPGGLVALPVLGVMGRALQRLRGRLIVGAADRGGDLSALAAPLAAAVAASVLLAAMPPAPAEGTSVPSERVIATDPATDTPPESGGIGSEVGDDPSPPPSVGTDQSSGGVDSPGAPSPVVAGSVRVFVGPEGAADAAEESEELPIHGRLGQAFFGADPGTVAQEVDRTLTSVIGAQDAP